MIERDKVEFNTPPLHKMKRSDYGILDDYRDPKQFEIEIKNLIDEDFINYKKPSMFIAMPYCSFKCDKECGCNVCQNSELAAAPSIGMEASDIALRFYNNPITKAIVFGGLEPFDSFEQICEIISMLWTLWNCSFDIKEMPDIIIYTGYYPDEIKDMLKTLKTYENTNIIIKFGRFIPDKPHRFDDLLGVELASNNQYAMKLEDINFPDEQEDKGYENKSK